MGGFLLSACAEPEGSGGPRPARPEPAPTGSDPTEPDPCELSGNVCLWAGRPQQALFSPDGQHRLLTRFYLPTDLAFGPDGAAYVVDFNNHRIRKVDPARGDSVTTITGTGGLGNGPPGDARAASWNHPAGVAFAPDRPDELFMAAWHNSEVVRVDLPASTVEVYAGTGARGYAGDGGPREEAVFDLVSSVAFDDRGVLYVADQNNQVVRAVDPATEVVSLVAGTPGVAGYGGDGARPPRPSSTSPSTATVAPSRSSVGSCSSRTPTTA